MARVPDAASRSYMASSRLPAPSRRLTTKVKVREVPGPTSASAWTRATARDSRPPAWATARSRCSRQWRQRDRSLELGGHAIHHDDVLRLASHPMRLTASADFAKTCTRVRAQSPLVRGVHSQHHVVQAESTEGI